MSNNINQETTNEIDLLKVTDNITRNLFNSFQQIKDFLKFIKKNIIYIILIFIIGGVAGYFYDKYNKKYYSNIIVSPNFETVDYLYDQVELLNSNVTQERKETLQELALDPNAKLSEIEVEPIKDIYKFIKNDDAYLEVFKTMSENNDAKKVIEDYATGKNFTLHKITVKSSSKISQEDLGKLMKFINGSKYYNDMRVKILANLDDQIAKNQVSITQIDSILNTAPSKNKVSNTLSVNDNSELNDLFMNKKALVHENHELNVHKTNLDYVITPMNYAANIVNKDGLNGKMKFVFPIVFVGGFFLIAFCRKNF